MPEKNMPPIPLPWQWLSGDNFTAVHKRKKCLRWLAVASRAYELRHATNHSCVGAKQFDWVDFFFSAQKTLLSSWCSPKPQLGLDWLFSLQSPRFMVSSCSAAGADINLFDLACVLNLGSTVQSTVSHQKCAERQWLPPMQPEDSKNINKTLDSSDEFPSWVQAKKLPSKDRDNNLQQNDSSLHAAFSICALAKICWCPPALSPESDWPRDDRASQGQTLCPGKDRVRAGCHFTH